MRAHREAGRPGALAIGLSAPQGCGKTTLTNALVERFAADGLTCAVASIDDFYLPGAEQDALAAANTVVAIAEVANEAATEAAAAAAAAAVAAAALHYHGVSIDDWHAASRASSTPPGSPVSAGGGAEAEC